MSFDAIVVGAGHNGLVCAAYLARAGFRTALVDARDSVGGCASTVDALDGARVNICNCDHRTVRTTPILDELDLAAHGLTYLDVEPAGLYLMHDESPAWPLFQDAERTIDGLRATHPHEVDGYRRYLRAAVPIARLLVDLANGPPTPRRVVQRVLRSHVAAAPTLLNWSRMSAAAVMRSFFSSEALIAPLCASGPAVWGVSPELAGTGLGAVAYAMSHATPLGRPVGGSGSLPMALDRAFAAFGGTTFTGERVDRILCEGSAVRGVRTDAGREFLAPVVVSAVDPRVTFLEWLADPPACVGTIVAKYRRQSGADGYESKLDAIATSRPTYRALDPKLADRLGFDPLVPTAFIAPTVAEMHQAWQAMSTGTVMDRPIMFANMPSVLDPTMRPACGGDIFSLEVLYTPFEHRGGWPSSMEPQRWLGVYSGLVEPGFALDRYRAMTPDRYESEFNLPRGHATAFSGGPLAAVLGRNRELTRYDTPLRGLYLTGAATFPGAGIWGASGRNTANVVLAKS